jgi:2-dehydropantoate 2-reductase
MKIAVMGSGGIGGYVGARLSAAGAEVGFIARGEHLAAIKADGLRIESPLGELHLSQVKATSDPMEIGPVDWVLFTVKLKDTLDAARSMAPLLGPNTRVLTLQNGVDSVDMIREGAPAAKILGGVIYLSAVIRRPGVIGNPGGMHRMILDGAGGDRIVARFLEVGAKATGLDIAATDDIQSEIWRKFVALAAFSGATSLIRRPLGEIRENPETRFLLRQLAEEALAIAIARGIGLPSNYVEATLAFADSQPPQTRSSMSEDLERGKPLELEWLSGRVHRLGEQLGIPTPAHSAVYRGLILYANGTPR